MTIRFGFPEFKFALLKCNILCANTVLVHAFLPFWSTGQGKQDRNMLMFIFPIVMCVIKFFTSAERLMHLTVFMTFHSY